MHIKPVLFILTLASLCFGIGDAFADDTGSGVQCVSSDSTGTLSLYSAYVYNRSYSYSLTVYCPVSERFFDDDNTDDDVRVACVDGHAEDSVDATMRTYDRWGGTLTYTYLSSSSFGGTGFCDSSSGGYVRAAVASTSKDDEAGAIEVLLPAHGSGGFSKIYYYGTY